MTKKKNDMPHEQVKRRIAEISIMSSVDWEPEIIKLDEECKWSKTVIRDHVKKAAQGGNLALMPQKEDPFAEFKDELVFSQGAYAWCQANVNIILAKHKAFKGAFQYDEFADVVNVTRSIPGSSLDEPVELQDEHVLGVVAWFNRNGFPKASKSLVFDGIAYIARLNKTHPVRDYLNGLQWDGTSRLQLFFHTYFGAADNPYTSATGIAWMVSAVARVMLPGCQADYMPVLESDQGVRKSSALRALTGDKWFGDNIPDLKGKEASVYMTGKWVIEKSEMDAVQRSEIETVKAFISRRVEDYRPPYGRMNIKRPRQCVFAGTTNRDDYAVDPSGSRRFWPIKCGVLDVEAIVRDRDQLWAEAVVRFKNKEKWYLGEAHEKLAAIEQEARKPSDPWEPKVSKLVGNKQNVYFDDVLDGLLVPVERQNPAVFKRISAILVGLGYKKQGKIKARGPDRDRVLYKK